jgi:hypothetical protein
MNVLLLYSRMASAVSVGDCPLQQRRVMNSTLLSMPALNVNMKGIVDLKAGG